jgi:hypothetical protein
MGHAARDLRQLDILKQSSSADSIPAAWVDRKGNAPAEPVLPYRYACDAIETA